MISDPEAFSPVTHPPGESPIKQTLLGNTVTLFDSWYESCMLYDSLTARARFYVTWKLGWLILQCLNAVFRFFFFHQHTETRAHVGQSCISNAKQSPDVKKKKEKKESVAFSLQARHNLSSNIQVFVTYPTSVWPDRAWGYIHPSIAQTPTDTLKHTSVMVWKIIPTQHFLSSLHV